MFCSFFCLFSPPKKKYLIEFNRTVNLLDEGEGCEEPDGSEHEEDSVADDEHVPEVERELQDAVHVALEHPVVEDVRVHEERRRTSTEERPPPPLVVLNRELQVRQGHGDACGDLCC